MSFFFLYLAGTPGSPPSGGGWSIYGGESMYMGSWKIDRLVTFAVNTHDATGALDADSVPTYRIYEDETTTPILTGSMAKLDDANTIGQYSEQVTLSAANGFEKGKSYNIRIASIVGGVTEVCYRYLQVEAEIEVNAISSTAALAIADAFLARDLGSGINAGTLNERTVRSALRMSRNKWEISSGTLTVKKEDDATTDHTRAVTNAAGNPIIGMDPA